MALSILSFRVIAETGYALVTAHLFGPEGKPRPGGGAGRGRNVQTTGLAYMWSRLSAPMVPPVLL